jgi:hypothetical protein
MSVLVVAICILYIATGYVILVFVVCYYDQKINVSFIIQFYGILSPPLLCKMMSFPAYLVQLPAKMSPKQMIVRLYESVHILFTIC